MSPLSARETVAASSPQVRWGGDWSPPRAAGGRRTALTIAVAMLAALLVPLTGTGNAAQAESVSVLPPLNIDAVNICSHFVVQTEAPDALVDVEVVAETDAGIHFCEPVGPDVINPVLIDPATGDLGAGLVETDGSVGGEATTLEGGPDGSGVFTFGLEAFTATSFGITAFSEDGFGNDDPDGDEASGTAQFIALSLGGGEEQEPVPGATQLVATLDCVPENESHPSGAKHTFFCKATQGDVGVLGAEISFDVTDGPNAEEIQPTPCTVTDSNGVSICEYTDSVAAGSPVGTDSVLGYADVDSAAPGPEVGAPNDEVRSSFGVAGAGAKRVKSRVTIRKKFRGAVRSAVAKCKKGRRVVIKKARKGRDKVIARDRSNRRGKYSVRKRRARGRFYAMAKRKRIRTKSGNLVICRAGRSKAVRRR